MANEPDPHEPEVGSAEDGDGDGTTPADAARAFSAVVGKGDALKQLLERSLFGDVTPGTFGRLQHSATLLIGDDPWALLCWVSHAIDEDEQTDVISELKPLTSEGRELLTELVALFGVQLAYAIDLSYAAGARGDDWKSILPRIVKDARSGDTTISITIRKYNREEPKVEGSPDSVLKLARALVRVLLNVDPDEFSEEAVQVAFELLDDLREHLGATLAPEDPKT